MRRQLCALILAASPGLCLADASASLLHATTREPRAFGYQLGDIVARGVTVHVPEGLVLDDASVPQPGARGRAVELRRVVRRDSSEPGGRRHELTLDYQLMLSPPQPRTFELPTLTLRFQGRPRAQELRIEAWPVTVSPLVQVDVSPRRGLGELQPDTPPPLIDTSATHGRLIAYAAASLLLLAYLAYVYIGLPWWSQAHRPFTQAWRLLRDLRADSAEGRWHDAFRRLHEALNRTAGEVVFEQGIDRFVGAHARFEPMRGELLRFFQLSRRAFFADGALAAAERTWLIEFSRRCRDAERGGGMSFDDARLLWLLPLAALPLLAQPGGALDNAWPALMKHDRASEVLGWALRVFGALALAALVIGLAGPYWPEYQVERVGKGAEIVLVLDRSRSMDQGFAGARRAGAAVKGTGPEAIDYYFSQSPGRLRESKGKVARQLLGEFAAKRPDDRFGMIVFSTLPIRTLEFTQKNEAIQAAIAAGNIGRGLSETNIGLAMLSALSYFENQPYTGSRIIMLVSDGGDRLDSDASESIARLALKHRVAIYWLYLRSANSPGLMLQTGEAPENADTVPEYALHRFFGSIGSSYHAFEAGDAASLQEAIEAVNRLENLPIAYRDTMPRRDLSGWGFGAALAGVLVLLAANLMEIRRWQ